MFYFLIKYYLPFLYVVQQYVEGLDGHEELLDKLANKMDHDQEEVANDCTEGVVHLL